MNGVTGADSEDYSPWADRKAAQAKPLSPPQSQSKLSDSYSNTLPVRKSVAPKNSYATSKAPRVLDGLLPTGAGLGDPGPMSVSEACAQGLTEHTRLDWHGAGRQGLSLGSGGLPSHGWPAPPRALGALLQAPLPWADPTLSLSPQPRTRPSLAPAPWRPAWSATAACGSKPSSPTRPATTAPC